MKIMLLLPIGACASLGSMIAFFSMPVAMMPVADDATATFVPDPTAPPVITQGSGTR